MRLQCWGDVPEDQTLDEENEGETEVEGSCEIMNIADECIQSTDLSLGSLLSFDLISPCT